MYINLVSTMFVLKSEKNQNIRKNDIKKLNVLLKKDDTLPEVPFEKDHMKSIVRENIESIIHSNIFHLEQVFSYDHQSEVDVIYLGITNEENVRDLSSDYKLVEFKLINKNTIVLGDKKYKYKTKEVEKNNNIEYFYEIDEKDVEKRRMLLELLISYKRIILNIDNTDIVFKFLGKSFTLEDVRLVYEVVKNATTDKSNFRKKIVKYCEKVEEEKNVSGYRPSQRYKFKPLKGDSWV